MVPLDPPRIRRVLKRERSPSPTPTFTTFVPLPRELRDQIYDIIIANGGIKYEMNEGAQYTVFKFITRIKSLGKVHAHIRMELLERFYSKQNKVKFYFEDLEEARTFLTDRVWCPQEYRADIKGQTTPTRLKGHP